MCKHGSESIHPGHKWQHYNTERNGKRETKEVLLAPGEIVLSEGINEA